MGIALILLGLLAAGMVVDFAVENWSEGAPDLTFALFGGSFTLTQMQVVIGAALLGAVAVLLCILGARLLHVSRGRHRTARRRVADLERENAALKKRRVETVAQGNADDWRERVKSQSREGASSSIEP